MNDRLALAVGWVALLASGLLACEPSYTRRAESAAATAQACRETCETARLRFAGVRFERHNTAPGSGEVVHCMCEVSE